MKKIISLLLVFLLVNTITGCNSKDEINQNTEINKNEKKLFESFLGTYKVSYNNELVSKEITNFTINKEFNLDKKCYNTDAGSTPEQEVVIENCISAIDFETIPDYNTYAYVYKIDENNAILRIAFNYIATEIDRNVEWIYMWKKHLCFKTSGADELVQTECVKRKNGFDSFEQEETLDTKYGFKLTKIK